MSQTFDSLSYFVVDMRIVQTTPKMPSVLVRDEMMDTEFGKLPHLGILGLPFG